MLLNKNSWIIMSEEGEYLVSRYGYFWVDNFNDFEKYYDEWCRYRKGYLPFMSSEFKEIVKIVEKNFFKGDVVFVLNLKTQEKIRIYDTNFRTF